MSGRSVLIVDDSPIAGALLRHSVERHGDWHVIGHVHSGVGLCSRPEYQRADVIILDLLLPERSGMSLLRELAQDKAVIVVSDVERDSPLVREALAQGARAFVNKRDLAEARDQTLHSALSTTTGATHATGAALPVVIIVGSTGAIGPLEHVLRNTAQVPAAFIVLQHIVDGSDVRFAEWLSTLGRPARIATHGMQLNAERILIPPSGRHLLLTRPEHVELSDAPPHESDRPSGALLLRSAAFLASRLTAIILSGLGRDGSEALPLLSAHGASCLVQKPDECAAPPMTRAALDAAPNARALSASEIALAIRTTVAHAR